MDYLLPRFATRLLESSSSSEDEVEPKTRKYKRPDYFTQLNEADFKRRFRVSKQSARRIVAVIGCKLEKPTKRNGVISPTMQVLIALRFYATGCFQLVTGDFFSVSQPAVSRIVKKVSLAIGQLQRHFITTPEDFNVAAEDFFNIKGFPRVIGAIDCTHVKITSPGGENGEVFRNRKGYFSINVQMVCDAKLYIWNVVAKWPGSTHDSTIFNDCHLRAQLENEEFGQKHLLGDSAYACKRYLLTPLLNPTTPAEHKYNKAHCSTRNTVERCFGILKRRFPCLSVGMAINVETVLTVITATAVLHNICLGESDFLEDEEDVEQNPNDGDEENTLDRNNVDTAVRTSLIDTVFSE